MMPLLAGAVFFDRDGVLNEDVGYLHKAEDFRWIEGARDALKLVQDHGLLSIVVTNQSGVGRGYYTLDDVAALHRWMTSDLSKDGISITAFYACPYHEEATVPEYRIADHPDRKPNPGMIQRAIADWKIDRGKSVMIGDKQSDMVAAQSAGVTGALFGGGNLMDFLARHLPR
ncbi:D-glycero-D-manno-heptose 1,7-bisphosphate phosphatase [Sphingobium sp. B11D3B]|uniref:D-glycero-alpha-D-manno-heptose-1,7-bisphosphate 7-phosphatase n=1 Tax=Sphingobium sp. B11D3B TaxID=2940575 RepID=UPI0022271AA4|nr:HAD family hydrolase [Sphingobium sp. B11D3B]MCW2387639.1 D-glycero-D-manno-heptose 1,7-bisphosphate phosphatase [Sphingobium sp. B11D3B]